MESIMIEPTKQRRPLNGGVLMRVHDIEITHDMQPQYLQMVAQKASTYRSDITIKFERENINLDAKSILGRDEQEAIDAMSSLLENNTP
jgi:hypothetical protein